MKNDQEISNWQNRSAYRQTEHYHNIELITRSSNIDY